MCGEYQLSVFRIVNICHKFHDAHRRPAMKPFSNIQAHKRPVSLPLNEDLAK
jgi:hypothetical protein